jgi:hypothetical protein
MRRGWSLGLAAALSTGAPGMAAGHARSIVWVDLCDPAHPGSRIPLPLGRDRDGAPGKACHAACGLAERRLSLRKSGS